MRGSGKIFLRLGIVLVLIIGFIHVMDARDSFKDAAYKGWLFYANGVACLVSAYGMYRGKDWAWNMGFSIAAISLMLYIASRTVGLPQIPAEPDAWLEPLGAGSMIAEGLFVAVFIAKKS